MDAADRAALLAAMYDDPGPPARPDAKADAAPHAADAAAGTVRRSRRMVMGAVSFDIPTVEYAADLERKLAQQARQIMVQASQIRRLEIMLTQLSGVARRQAGAVNDLGRDLDRFSSRDP